MEGASKFTGATFSLTGEDGLDCFEGVDALKYLGQVIYQTNDDWPAVLHNIRRARQVWGWLGNFLRREGAYLIISAKFYWEVAQTVLLFGAKTWVLLAERLNNIEGVHVGFLRQVTGMKSQRLGDDTWTKEGQDRAHQAE